MLDWDACNTPGGRQRLDYVRELLATRRREIVPHLDGIMFDAARAEGGVLHAHWRLTNGGRLTVLANLSGNPAPRPAGLATRRALFGGSPGNVLPPWSVFWSAG